MKDEDTEIFATGFVIGLPCGLLLAVLMQFVIDIVVRSH